MLGALDDLFADLAVNAIEFVAWIAVDIGSTFRIVRAIASEGRNPKKDKETSQ